MGMHTIAGWLIGGFGTKAAVIGGAVLLVYEVANKVTETLSTVTSTLGNTVG